MLFLLLQEIQGLSIIDRLIYGEWSGKTGDKFTQLVNLTFLATCVALFLRGWMQIGKMRVRVQAGFFASLLLFASASWSIDPAISLREAILFLFMTVGLIGIAASVDVDEFMKLLGTTCLIAASATLCLYVAAPHTVVTESGDFRGIFSQKNLLGQAMIVGCLAYLHQLRGGQGRRVYNLLALAILCVTCVASRSATSSVTIVTMFGVEVVSTLFRRGGVARVVGCLASAACIPAALAAALAPDAILNLLGKDPTLTGRTDIWAYVLLMIAQRPLLGWGYYAFWSTSNPFAVELNDMLQWIVPEAHNGVLEITLHLGLVGLATFLFLWAHELVLAIRCMRRGEWTLGMSTLLICIAIAQLSVSERILIEPFHATNSPFLVLGLLCERALRSARTGRNAPGSRPEHHAHLQPDSMPLGALGQAVRASSDVTRTGW